MKTITSLFIALLVSLSVNSSALAMDNIVDNVTNGCKKELSKYCKGVTPGEGRILACLYARSDKLSGQCEFALYDSAVQLERFVAALTYVANECDADIDKHCGKVEMGEGRILSCLDKNSKKVSKRCNQAMKDVGAN